MTDDKSKSRLAWAVVALAVLATYYYLRMRNCGCAIVGPVAGGGYGEPMCAGSRWGRRYWQGDPDRMTLPQLVRAGGTWMRR